MNDREHIHAVHSSEIIIIITVSERFELWGLSCILDRNDTFMNCVKALFSCIYLYLEGGGYVD